MGVGKETSQDDLSLSSPPLSLLSVVLFMYFFGGGLKERLKDGCVQTNGQRPRVQVEGAAFGTYLK